MADVDAGLAHVKKLMDKLDLELSEITRRDLDGVVSTLKKKAVLEIVRRLLSPDEA